MKCHNLSRYDHPVTIWVTSQSSSVISSIGGCLRYIEEGFLPSFALFPSL